MLEGKFRLIIDEPAGHHQVAGNPLCALGFEGLDLVLRGAVQFLARNVLVDLGRAFPVRPVGAAEVCGVRHADRTVLLAIAAKAARAGAAATGLGAGVIAVETARCPVLPVTERPAVLATAGTATKTTAVTLTITARTVAERLTITITKLATVAFTVAARTVAERLTITITKLATVAFTVAARTVAERLAVTITERLTLATAGTATKTTAVTLTITARTVAERLTITKLATVPFTVAARTITERLTITITKLATVPFAITARTITERLAVTITERLTLTTAGPATKTTAVTLTLTARTITERLTITITKLATVPFAITTRTITVRLAVTITERLTLTTAGRAFTREVVALAIGPGPESAGVSAGIVVAAERATVVAAVATVVLGHMDSSCCEPTTGATAAARFVSYATRNQALRSPYIFINSSGATKSPGTVGAQGAVSWPSSQ
ncbi:hypothetical protein NG819_17315 [Pseudarthrobacter sp. Fe7]|nr:hypothetical protein NG819_17315 [Pseudarthrobacter sp. Fe7]